jgi:predicted metal-dependent peptidase
VGAEEINNEARDEVHEAEGNVETRDEAREAEGNVEARDKAREVEGSLAEAAAGGASSSGLGAASPQVGVKRGRWAASDE